MERDLHRLIRRELRDLGIHPPLDVDELCRALSSRRGRPLHLRSAPLKKPGHSGAWCEYENFDVILYQQETTRLHQEHIILHEVGHILLADREEAAAELSAEPAEVAVDPERQDAEIADWSSVLPLFAPEMIKRMARRCSYDDGEECAAELAATIILEWSSVLDTAAPMSEDPSLRRVQSALGDRRGWL
ncbi:hypothetical protein OG285_25400 [Streptomyces sp. NBC_01471]|uniref:hypothetical protein n=1 Tax=Streptomyces sp. NBC_01471 TaxID=2903879 RepID=UPI00325144D9